MTPWRVLVLDASDRQALAACRSLGRAGHHVETAGYTSAELSGDSRYSRRYTRLPGPGGPSSPFERALEAAVRAQGTDIVIASNDATLARLGAVATPVPTFPVVDAAFVRLADKAGLAAVCTAAGVPYPRTFAQRRPEDLDDALRSVGLPAVAKSSRSAEANGSSVRFSPGATVAASADELRRTVDRVRSEGLLPVVQERIPGREKLNAVVIRRDGRTSFRYAHRVLREAPRSGGIGITLETVDAHGGGGAEAVDVLERVCDAAGYQGLAQAEFYRDARDGRLYVIDVNPRLWGSTWFVERMGLRVVERGVRDVLGLPEVLPPPRYPVGRRFHHLSGELRWLATGQRRAADVLTLLRTSGRRDLWEYADWSDPGPLLRYAARRVSAVATGGMRASA